MFDIYLINKNDHSSNPTSREYKNWLLIENQVIVMYMDKWLMISVAAKELGCTIHGIRIIAERGDLKLRQVLRKTRLCNEISVASLNKYKSLIAKGLRRNPKSRRISEGTGHRVKNKGYILVHKPKHPRAMCDGYVFEQWLVMEAHLGRYLTKSETVHHINRIRDDNRIENLHLYASRSEHMKEAHNQLKDILLQLRRES